MPAPLRLALLAALPALLAAPAPAEVKRVSNWAADPSFRLVNRDAAPMQDVYVALTGRQGWGTDRLGWEALAPGRHARIALPAGHCLNDIRVVFADGRVVERRQVDTCALPHLALP